MQGMPSSERDSWITIIAHAITSCQHVFGFASASLAGNKNASRHQDQEAQ